MSSKVKSFIGAVVVGLAFIAGATQGCGGSSGTNTADLCNRVCQKTIGCLPAGTPYTIDQCKTTCTQQTMGTSGKTCSNESAIVSKVNECLALASCDAFQGCAESIPDCVSTTGTAGTGSTGTAGTTGAAGSSSTGAAGFTFDAGGFDLGGLTGAGGTAGATCATACAKADACCKAVLGANSATCVFQTSCAGASDQSQAVLTCNIFLQGAGASGPAACK